MGPVLERAGGGAGEFHARTVPDTSEVLVWWFEIDRSAVAIGSGQVAEDVLDLERCADARIEVVRRRSGGGAVLLIPGEVIWVDVVVPTGHRLWSDDVSEAMLRVGERWVEALAPMVHGRHLSVHHGPMTRTAWSTLVCFDGVGPGEVLVDGRKLVGISQRRTRQTARFQCAVHLQYDPLRLPPLLAGPLPDDPLRPVATLTADVDPVEVVERLLTALG
jgi:lipoate---protein ligase